MKPHLSFSAGGIVAWNDSILLVCENGTFWGFPKGRIEAGETAFEAASREIVEETGCREFSLVKKLGEYQRHPFTLQNELDTSEIKEITMYLFQTATNELSAPIEKNIVGRWVAKGDVESKLTHPEDLAFYKKISGLI